MQFKIIPPEVLRSCLSNLLMNDYRKTYEHFIEFVNFKITKDQFEEFKKRKITIEEITRIISRTRVNEKEEVERVKIIWNKKEEKIVSAMNELCGLPISTDKIACYVDPYQKGGYYGEDSITVGNYSNPEDILFVITHELFHIFYWMKLAELKITKSTMGKESSKEWMLAEASVHLITTEPTMRRYWKDIKIETYPEIKDMYEKVKSIWAENSFENYLKKSYELLENDEK